MGYLLRTTQKNLSEQILTFYKTLRQCGDGRENNKQTRINWNRGLRNSPTYVQKVGLRQTGQ